MGFGDYLPHQTKDDLTQDIKRERCKVPIHAAYSTNLPTAALSQASVRNLNDVSKDICKNGELDDPMPNLRIKSGNGRIVVLSKTYTQIPCELHRERLRKTFYIPVKSCKCPIVRNIICHNFEMGSPQLNSVGPEHAFKLFYKSCTGSFYSVEFQDCHNVICSYSEKYATVKQVSLRSK